MRHRSFDVPEHLPAIFLKSGPAFFAPDALIEQCAAINSIRKMQDSSAPSKAGLNNL
jgi:hypothetical protein